MVYIITLNYYSTLITICNKLAILVSPLEKKKKNSTEKPPTIPEFDPRRLKAKGQKCTATTGLLALGSCNAGLDVNKNKIVKNT